METKIERSSGSKKVKVVAIVLILVLAVLILVSLIFRHRIDKGFQSGDKNRQTVPAENLPSGMPLDLPFLSRGTPVQNYETEGGGSLISNRKILILSTQAEIKLAYLEYFAKFGWEVTTDFAEGDKLVLSAVKDGAFLTVSSTDTGEARVLELTLSRPK